MTTHKILPTSLLCLALAGCGGGGEQQVNLATGTSGNDIWHVTGGWSGTLDGLDGVDTLYLGTSLRSAYTVKKNTDGSVSVDSVSGASSALHAKLVNMELLVFDSGKDVLDLRTL